MVFNINQKIQIQQLQSALISYAPVLQPRVSLLTLCKSSEKSELHLCSKMLNRELEDLIKKTINAKVCSICNIEKIDSKKDYRSFIPIYQFDVNNKTIIIQDIKIVCKKCQNILDLNKILILSSRSLAFATATQTEYASGAGWAKDFPLLSNKMNDIYRHFLTVNKLDAESDATTLQTVISAAFSLYLLVK